MRLSLILLTACCLASEASFAAEQWMEIHSPHFSIVTDGGEKRGRQTALRFEQMRAMFAQLTSQKAVNSSRPVHILAFKDARGLRQMAPLWQGKPIELAGLYEKGDHEDFIALDLSAENGWAAVFHEYAHLLLNSNSLASPVWFDEGFAEYFSSLQIDSKEVLVGAAPEYSGIILTQDPLIPVPDMLRVNSDSRIYNESGDHRGMFYAESWAMVHYLYDKQRMPQAMQYFRLTLQQGKPIPESFQSAFGESPEQFEKDLHGYIFGGLLKGFRVPTPQGIEPAQFSGTLISDDDAGIAIADMHLSSRDHGDEAIAEYNAVLRAHPGDLRADRGLGFALLRRNDLPDAELHLEKAAADSPDPMVHYYYALLLQQRMAGAAVDGGLLARQKRELQTTVQLDPQLAGAYELLAINAAASGDPKEAIHQVQNAIRLEPRNEGYVATLSGFYLQDNQLQQARETLARLEQSHDPQTRDPRIASMIASQENYLKTVEQYEAMASSARTSSAGTGNAAAGTAERALSSAASPQPVAVDDRQVSPAGTEEVRGVLASVECSDQDDTANLVIVHDKRLLLVHARRSSIVLAGTNAFSCSWKDKEVSVKYHPDGLVDSLSILP